MYLSKKLKANLLLFVDKFNELDSKLLLSLVDFSDKLILVIARNDKVRICELRL